MYLGPRDHRSVSHVRILRRAIRPLAVVILAVTAVTAISAQQQTKNVILITLDGARTQEIFGGLDEEIFRSTNKSFQKTATYKRFSAATAKERREKLMPFFWKTLLVSYGSIAGDRELNSSVQTTNKLFFSYPGYSEMLTGQAHDDVIKSNSHPQNPYPSVLDFLQKKLKLDKDQVADFSSWDAFERISTNSPGKFVINAGYMAYDSTDKEIAGLSRAQFETLPAWNGARFDYYTFRFALAHMRKFHPRVIHIGFDETDDWAHEKNYERLLQTLNMTDGFLKELWEFVQTDPTYKGRTSIIITTDHGRGKTIADWHDHGADVAEAQNIWMAFFSPDVKLRGEWKDAETIYLNQVPATLCRYLNLDYSDQNPKAGKPIEQLFAE
ncbi:MAG: phosphoglyceromutase [Acidobacteria bacterium]|nr:phosphoglyceromutase [Acidobacteriota bacterium]